MKDKTTKKPGRPKKKSEAAKKAEAKKPAEPKKAKEVEGVRAGPQPDRETMIKVRCRTQGGHRLYLPAIEMYAPGDEETLEVSAAQLEYLKADGRIMLDDQIDDFMAELATIKDRKPKGNATNVKRRKKIPESPAVNMPGGERMPNVARPEGMRTHEEQLEHEQNDEAGFMAKPSEGKKRKRAR